MLQLWCKIWIFNLCWQKIYKKWYHLLPNVNREGKKKSPNCKLEKRGHINLMYFPFFLSFFFFLFFVYFLSTSIDAVENLAELCLKGGTPKLRSPVIVTQAFTWSPWFMNKHPTTYLGVDSSPDLLYSGFSSYVPWLVPLLL